MKAKQIHENLDFERTGDVLRDIGIGAKRNIPKYYSELANDVIEDSGWQNKDLEIFQDLVLDDLKEYGYYNIEDYLEMVAEEDGHIIPEIENSIATFKWKLEEFVKKYVWKSEVIEDMVKTLYYYKMSEGNINFDWLINNIDKALKLNWNIKESINFERGQDPKSSMGIGMETIIKKLMKEDDKEYKSKEDALQWAAENGYLDVVKYLMEQGVDIHVRNDYALQGAAEKGHLNIVKYLVEYGANIHIFEDYALRYAVANGHLDVVKYLVAQGADIHAKNDFALQWAAEEDHFDVVKYLKEVIANES